MSALNDYPSDYRAEEVRRLTAALRAGECAAVLGLSGAGKSNLLRCLAERPLSPDHAIVLVDANRLSVPSAAGLFQLIQRTLGEPDTPGADPWAALEAAVNRRLQPPESSLTLVIDRLDALSTAAGPALFGPLRAVRDAHKYRLTYVVAARRPLEARNELAELFFANTWWLGPLSAADAGWTVDRFLARKGLHWEKSTRQALIDLTRGYPAFLRAACEAHAAGAALTLPALAAHPALAARLAEFWSDAPTAEELAACGLTGLPLLARRSGDAPPAIDAGALTAKENRLWAYFQAHPEAVCAKDDLIRAVWPEDKVFAQGVRDDSLAQLVRRLREKIEPDPAQPRYILTVPGRGYRYARG